MNFRKTWRNNRLTLIHHNRRLSYRNQFPAVFLLFIIINVYRTCQYVRLPNLPRLHRPKSISETQLSLQDQSEKATDLCSSISPNIKYIFLYFNNQGPNFNDGCIIRAFNVTSRTCLRWRATSIFVGDSSCKTILRQLSSCLSLIVCLQHTCDSAIQNTCVHLLASR